MQTKRTRKEILTKPYVNITDIQILLQLPKEKARLIFYEINKEENKKMFRPHESKVPLHSVLKLLGINYNFLEKQVKGEFIWKKTNLHLSNY